MTTFLWIMAGGFVAGIIGLIIFATRKKPSAVAIMLSLVVSVMCAILFVVDISVDPVKNDDSSQSEEVSSEEDPVDYDVTFAEIYNAFKQNELVAKDIYNGNRYSITAKINGMETGGIMNMGGGATLTMEIKVDNTVVFFLAEFEQEQEEALKQVVVGDTITFIGTCENGTFGDCELSE